MKQATERFCVVCGYGIDKSMGKDAEYCPACWKLVREAICAMETLIVRARMNERPGYDGPLAVAGDGAVAVQRTGPVDCCGASKGGRGVMGPTIVKSEHIRTPGGRHYRVRTTRAPAQAFEPPRWLTEVHCATADGSFYGTGAVWVASPDIDTAYQRHGRVVGYIEGGAEDLLFWLRESVDWQRKEGQ